MLLHFIHDAFSQHAKCCLFFFVLVPHGEILARAAATHPHVTKPSRFFLFLVLFLFFCSHVRIFFLCVSEADEIQASRGARTELSILARPRNGP